MERIPLGDGFVLRATITHANVDGIVLNPETGEKAANISFSLPRKRRSHAFLHMFESSQKGLGKKMFCALITHLVGSGALREDTEVRLQASGGSCSHDEHTESEESIDAYLTEYPDLRRDVEHDAMLEKRAPTYEEKAHAVCASRANDKLIAYYRRYGFEVIEKFGTYADMTSTVSKIMAECGRPGGGRTRRTKRSLSSRARRMRNGLRTRKR